MLCEENNGKSFVICTIKLNLQTICSADTLLMDGTFKSCPKPFYQLYTILANPLAYANLLQIILPVSSLIRLSSMCRLSIRTVIVVCRVSDGILDAIVCCF